MYSFLSLDSVSVTQRAVLPPTLAIFRFLECSRHWQVHGEKEKSLQKEKEELVGWLADPRFWLCGAVLSLFSRFWFFATPWTVASPGSSLLAISQAEILEWVATSFSRRTSLPRDRTCIS